MKKSNWVYEAPECIVMQVSPEGVMCQSSFISGSGNNEFIGDDVFDDNIWL